MPLYFFNLYNDVVSTGEEGIDLPDDEAARSRAVMEARAMAAESVQLGHLTRSHRIDYLDEAGTRVGTVRFDEAVDIRS